MNSSTPARIIAFGKIPTYRDYVQMNCSGPVWGRFDDWLQLAVDGLRRSLGSGFKDQLRSSPAFRFLFTVREAGGLVSGVAQPSTDGVGRFSFLILASILPVNNSPLEIASAPVRLRTMYERAVELAASAAAGGLDKDEFLSAAMDLASQPETVPSNLGSEGTDGLALEELRKTLGQVTLPQLSRFKLGFRLPLSDSSPEASVTDWLEAAVDIVGGADQWNPSTFWTTSRGTDQSVLLCISEPLPSMLLSVVHESTELDEVLNLVGARS